MDQTSWGGGHCRRAGALAAAASWAPPSWLRWALAGLLQHADISTCRRDYRQPEVMTREWARQNAETSAKKLARLTAAQLRRETRQHPMGPAT